MTSQDNDSDASRLDEPILKLLMPMARRRTGGYAVIGPNGQKERFADAREFTLADVSRESTR